MIHRSIRSLVLALTLLAPTGSAAQSHAPYRKPDRLARALFDAIRTQSWDVAASLVDSEATDVTYRQSMRFLQQMGSHSPWELLDSLLGKIDSAPDSVRRQRIAHMDTLMVFTTTGVATREEAEALSARAMLARMLAQRHGGSDSVVGRKWRTYFVFREVLGTVMEDDTLAHVTYRTTTRFSSGEVRRGVELLSVRRSRGAWYALPDGELFGGRGMFAEVGAVGDTGRGD